MRSVGAAWLAIVLGSASLAGQESAAPGAPPPEQAAPPVSARVLVVGRSDDASPFTGVVIGEALLHELPLFGRRFLTAALLAPGFTGTEDYPNAQGQFPWTVNVIVDGASDYSKWRASARSF